MTSEQVQKLSKLIEQAKVDQASTDESKRIRTLQLEYKQAVDDSMRVYQLAEGFEVHVNPVDEILWAPWLNTHLRCAGAGGTVPYKVLKGLAAVVALFEDWKNGILREMPPSGTVASAIEHLGYTL